MQQVKDGREAKVRELVELESRAARLRAEIHGGFDGTGSWAPDGYYTSYHILAGMVLGFLGACSSLLFNVVGSAMFRQHPLQLIRVYLTFPLGEAALQTDDGFTLAMGCLLYMATGMALGVPVHLVLSRFFAGASSLKRFAVASALGVALWALMYYGLLLWVQPALFGGDWIVRLVPAWVGAGTHLAFAWTILLVDEVIGTFHAPGAPSSS
jgi:hypothetical protein